MDPNNDQSNPTTPTPLPGQSNPVNPFAPAQPPPPNASLDIPTAPPAPQLDTPPQPSVLSPGVEPVGSQSTQLTPTLDGNLAQDMAIVSPQTAPVEPMPTFIPPTTPLDATTQTIEANPAAPLGQIPNTPIVDGIAPSTSEPVPTDLSQLVSSDNTAESLSASPIPVTAPEILVSSSSGGSEAAQVVTNGSHKPTKWLLIAIGGGVLVLALGGAVAYFVLGVGNSGTLPTSVPAEQTQQSDTSLSNSPSALIPTSSPALPSQEQTGASSPSATFGNLDGVAPSPTPATQSGTSAAELLRQRQAASSQ